LEVSVHQLNGETPCAEGSLCYLSCVNEFEGRVDVCPPLMHPDEPARVVRTATGWA